MNETNTLLDVSFGRLQIVSQFCVIILFCDLRDLINAHIIPLTT